MISDNVMIPDNVRCASFVGGGGKTTLMLRLAVQLGAEGRRVVVTTTTHMLRPGIPDAMGVYPENLPWLDREDEQRLRSLMSVSSVVIAGQPDPEHEKKICGFSRKFFRRMTETADVILVEADGSRRCPVKVPKTWEPVIPEETDLTFAVVGLSALDRPIGEVSYDPEETALFLKKKTTDPLTEKDICCILRSEDGLRRSAAGEYRVLLNQADTVQLQQRAERILRCLEGDGIKGQILTRREKIAVILLASGLSRRFGSNKLLALTEDGRPMYLRTVEIAETVRTEYEKTHPAAGMQCILVSSWEEIREEMRKREGWTVIRNDHPEAGISGSIRLGVQRADAADGYMFCVCDQPDLRAGSVKKMIEEWKNGGWGIAGLRSGGRMGNPKIFSAAYRERLLALEGDEGGRRIVRANPDDTIWVTVEDPEELKDIDTGEEWEQRRSYTEN